jgi:phosphatidylserine/phosphatidylglycerophosphate/cardiolipin synthase-like enzyme
MQASISARYLLLKSVAQNGILRISQQKIANTDVVNQTNIVIWPGEFLGAIVSVLKDKNAAVQILLSHHTPTYSNGYSDDMGGKALKGVITDRLAKAMGNDRTAAQALVNKLLTIRQTKPGTYNHGKVWIVDDQLFYVGSDNIYPAYLQEFGYIVGDQDATRWFIISYWNKLWNQGITP